MSKVLAISEQDLIIGRAMEAEPKQLEFGQFWVADYPPALVVHVLSRFAVYLLATAQQIDTSLRTFSIACENSAGVSSLQMDLIDYVANLRRQVKKPKAYGGFELQSFQ